MNRGTESIQPIENGFEFLCDCAAWTRVHIRCDCSDPTAAHPLPPDAEVATHELSVLCSGCGATHWLTINPVFPPLN